MDAKDLNPRGLYMQKCMSGNNNEVVMDSSCDNVGIACRM